MKSIHRSCSHPHGQFAGLLLALAFVAFGFLIHTSLAQTGQFPLRGLTVGLVLLALLLVVFFRAKSR